ncbi:galactokinase [Corynebacterium sp. ES2794-CONJ1]|uniref:galactokinase n=1 Tax=unclassified Corynebacterium TaxID=2624378 RepID=UPI002167C843|nr:MULTISPECIES: galactokinase [unclassified Corynebacterium]MCS4490951.1 galactokinase [Corynebacterium sp. ES2715-CONJ3]MCU9518535.1 galactokinase [Corynebacterium sp. ES2794-CONJ1]
MSYSPRWMQTHGDGAGASLARELFVRTFNRAPEITVAAPGRVNLIGEHVDYAGGICLPFALGQRSYVAIARRDDRKLAVVSDWPNSEIESIDLRDIGPQHPASWAGYVVGSIWAAYQAGVIDEQGFDIAVVSDVPVGAGLSSSAAIECSAALAAVELIHPGNLNDEIREHLVVATMRAENEIVGASTGGLDQKISLFARPGHALAIDFGDNSSQHVPFDIESAGLSLLICNTNAPHFLGDGQYASRRAVIDGVAHAAGVSTLRQVEDPFEVAASWAAKNQPASQSAQQWQEVVYRRVRHVVSEIDRTAEAINRLKANDIAGFGTLMWQSHASLRDDYEVSTPELDLVVEEARAIGALGARMTGGGFGGSAIALVRTHDATELARRIDTKARDQGFPIPEFLLATPSYGARRLD